MTGGCLKHVSNYCLKHRKDPAHHSHFIPVSDLTPTHIDQWVPGHDPDRQRKAVDVIKDMARRVVMVRTSYISLDRPPTARDGKTYLLYNMRGRMNVILSGSGWIRKVEMKEGYCQCDGCRCTVCRYADTVCGDCESKGHTRIYWAIDVQLVKHIVFDQSECDGCKVTFFDDTEGGCGTSIDGNEVEAVTLTGGKMRKSNIDKDFCKITVYTHDEDMVQIVGVKTSDRLLVKRMRRLTELLNPRDNANDDDPDADPDAVPDADPDADPDAVPDTDPNADPDADPDAVPNNGNDDNGDSESDSNTSSGSPIRERIRIKCLCIGHPHGKIKHITFGNMESKTKDGSGDGIIFSLRTCPGMAGSLIVPIGRTHADPSKSLRFYTHSGSTDLTTGMTTEGTSDAEEEEEEKDKDNSTTPGVSSMI